MITSSSSFRFRNLLIWLFLYLVLSPFISNLPHAGLLFQCSFTAVLLAAVYAIHKEDSSSLPALLLMVILIGLIWLNGLKLLNISIIAIDLLLIVFLGLLVITFGRYILAAGRVNSELIAAALCLYIFIGLFWAGLLILLQSCEPGSFVGSGLDKVKTLKEEFQHFNYLSFITMTTLGYGDITPKTPKAMALCQVEAIIGQFFTAVLVARLVGIQVAQQLSGGGPK